jgi:hypothetical protein
MGHPTILGRDRLLREGGGCAEATSGLIHQLFSDSRDGVRFLAGLENRLKLISTMLTSY